MSCLYKCNQSLVYIQPLIALIKRTITKGLITHILLLPNCLAIGILSDLLSHKDKLQRNVSPLNLKVIESHLVKIRLLCSVTHLLLFIGWNRDIIRVFI